LAKGGPKMRTSDPEAKGSMSLNASGMTVVAWSMDQLALYFAAIQREPVLNGTGLPGTYDFKLAWSETNSAYPSLFTAVQEQLGLKLEPRKEPIQMLIVESATRPSFD